MAPHASYPVLAVYFSDIYPILRSVASAYTISHNIDHKWSGVDLYFTGMDRAGVWELQIPKPQDLRNDINWQTNELVNGFVRHASEGPEELKTFLSGKLEVKAKCLSNIHSTISSFNQINNKALFKLDAAVKLAKAGRFTNNLALIGATATAVALYAGGALWTTAEAAKWVGGGQIGIVGAPMLKSLGVSLVKSWDQASEAKAVQVAFEVKKSAASVGADKSGDGMINLEKQFKTGRDVANASEAEELAKSEFEKSRKKRKKTNKHKGKRGHAKRASQTTRRVKKAKAKYYNAKEVHRKTRASAKTGKALKGIGPLGRIIKAGATTIFTAWDIYDVFAELNE